MKQYAHVNKPGPGYGGCLWMAVLLIIAVLALASCATTKKDGCGTENYKHKFRS